MSNIYLPSLIPPPNCNCRSCKPLLYIPYHQSRALSISPQLQPLSIPTQPQSRYSEPIPMKTPPPPPRRYQLIPIHNESNVSASQFQIPQSQQSIWSVSSVFTSFGKPHNYDGHKNDYVNTVDISDRSSTVLNKTKRNGDERRRAYYYKKLNMNMNSNELLTSSAEESEPTTSTATISNSNPDAEDVAGTAEANGMNSKLIDEEVARNTLFNANLMCGSGASLDSVV